MRRRARRSAQPLGDTVGVVALILDALRRLGSPTQKSALQRQDEYHDLDRAFTTWSTSPEKHDYTDEAVVEITGAAFGQLCAERLNMRWVKITDIHGTALALQGVEKDFRAFPHFSVEKRLKDAECGFFAPIFAHIKKASEDDYRPTGAA